MKIAVIGSRDFHNYDFFKDKLEYLIQNLEEVVFVSGGARTGADNLIKKYAKENNKQLIEYLADWENLGKSAGMIRNRDIIKEADGVIAFWNGSSKGTKNAIDLARKKGIKVKIVKV